MSAGDILITIIIWLYKNTLLNLPENVAGLSLAEFESFLNGLKANLTYSLSGISNVFPVDWAFTFIGVVIAGELIILAVKGGIFVINLIRGSGA